MNVIIFSVIFSVFTGCDTQANFITATPSMIYPGSTSKLVIDCNIKPLSQAISNVFVMQIEKIDNGNTLPLATATSNGVTTENSGGGRMSAQGNVDVTGQGPFITLTINSPNKLDDGSYRCRASTTDKTGTLVNLSYTATVTAEDLTLDQLTKVVLTLAAWVAALTDENQILHTNLTEYHNRLVTMESKPCSCQADTTLITETIEEVKTNFTQKLMTHDNMYSKLTNEIAGLLTNQSALARDVNTYSRTTQTLTSNVVYTSTKFDLFENRVKVLENISVEQYSEIAQLSADGHGLAFSYTNAAMNQAQSVITFSTRLSDNIHGYDPASSVFVAPRAGLYLFSLTIATDAGSVQVAIKVRQTLLAYVVASYASGPQQGSTSVVVPMTKGDNATVKISHVIGTPVTLRKDACIFSGTFVGTL